MANTKKTAWAQGTARGALIKYSVLQLWSNAPGFLVVYLFVYLLSRLQIDSFWMLFIVVASFTFTVQTILTIKKKEPFTIGKQLKIIVTLFLTIGLVWWLGGYGLIGFISILLIFTAWRLYAGRKFIKETYDQIDIYLFGKPFSEVKKQGKVRWKLKWK